MRSTCSTTSSMRSAIDSPSRYWLERLSPSFIAPIMGIVARSMPIAPLLQSSVPVPQAIGIDKAYLAGWPVLLLSDLSDGARYSHHGPCQPATGFYGTWDARN